MLRYLRMGNKRIKFVWWALIILTVLTFVTFFAAGYDPSSGQRADGSLGSVNGTPITREQFALVLEEAKNQYRGQFGGDPADQDAITLQSQAWRGVVTQRLMQQRAKSLGLGVSDAEITWTLKNLPPQMLASLPDFQTNGKFDMAKYQTAVNDPSASWWAPFEEMTREQLPPRKLQERLAASLKLSEPELLERFHEAVDRVEATVVMVTGALSAPAPEVQDADLAKAYEAYKNRFSAPARTQLEVLRIPRKFSDEEVRVAREQAHSISTRSRAGESFAALARDYSQGPGAAQGGEIQRMFQPMELGPELGPKVMLADTGMVFDPIEQNGRFIIVKLLQKSMTPSPQVKVAQIMIKARQSEDALRLQLESAVKIRSRAVSVGLAKAATEAGLATTKSSFYDYNNTPQDLVDFPDAADWGLSHKKNEVSPVFQGLDAFSIVAVAGQYEAGPTPRADLEEQLRVLAQNLKRVDAAKPLADQVAQALKSGQTLEQAAAAAGQVPFKIPAMTRLQPDPRLANAPEVAGVLFGAPLGKPMGPYRTPGGWFFVRADARVLADTTQLNPQSRGQITQELLGRRQNEFFGGWVTTLRQGATIKDGRPETNQR
ncbi:MAG: hypothetical protein HOP12_15885 [Candidatus Eisenbacteria bacterium]|uniref:Periplasmic chaperone PpiD n=1 Tax=Eiseniibacteriota bacterium TaxID=2212470 RepID=A0A849SU28_UNCEI|nr:hypothetical protein [Candidatus Eisenbacteria bacterium]